MPSVAIIGTRGYPSFYGGFETAVRHLAPFLGDRGWNVTVYGRPGSTVVEDRFENPNIQSIETRGLESKSFSTLSYGLSAAINARRRGPDVALVMNVANGYWLPILRSARIPVVVNVDGIEWQRAKWGRMARGVFLGGARLTARMAQDLVFDAEAIGDFWGREFDREGTYIPYGGTLPASRSEPPLGLESGKYVLMVARLVPENTVPEFFDAIPRLAGKCPVVVVGSSGYGGELEERIAKLDGENSNVRWLGHVKDDALLSSLWEHAGAYFHGHSVGGTNPALVQAMACGAPIVALDTVFNREVLGDSGSFVGSHGSDIAEEIEAFLRSPARRELASVEAKKRASTRFDWFEVCERYESVLIGSMQGEK